MIVDEAEDILGRRFLHRRYPDGYMRKVLAEAGATAPTAVQVAVLYPDARIQHAGRVLGVGGPVGHAFRL